MPSIGAMELAARIGFTARAILYATIGYLAIRARHAGDAQSALDMLHHKGGGVALAAMAAGLVGYGLWRLAEAWIDSEDHGRDAKGRIMRIGGAISGIVHLGLAGIALKLLLGWDESGGSGAEAGAQTALHIPGGQAMILAVAAGLVATGLYQVRKGIGATFLKHLDPRAARQEWVRWIGRIGHVARAIVFLLVGWFLCQAALNARPSEAGGMAQALGWLPEPVGLAVAAGLGLFGLYCLVEARYRRINAPDAIARLRGAFSG